MASQFGEQWGRPFPASLMFLQQAEGRSVRACASSDSMWRCADSLPGPDPADPVGLPGYAHDRAGGATCQPEAAAARHVSGRRGARGRADSVAPLAPRRLLCCAQLWDILCLAHLPTAPLAGALHGAFHVLFESSFLPCIIHTSATSKLALARTAMGRSAPHASASCTATWCTQWHARLFVLVPQSTSCFRLL